MMKIKKHIFTPIIPLLIFSAGGCTAVQQKTHVPAKTQKVSLAQAVRLSVEQSADMRAVESLQLIAREHVEKSRLLELPDMIYDLPRRLGNLSIENDFRLDTLDHAIESCRILTCPAQADLNAVQKKAEARKIRREIAFKWVQLAYFRNLKKAGIVTQAQKMKEKEIILELSISSGIPEKMIPLFDLDALPEPGAIKPVSLPDYAEKIKAFYNGSPDAALRFADIVYRLPSELLHRKDSNFQAAFELAQAAGTAIKLDIVNGYMDKALKDFQKAEQTLKTQGQTPVHYAARERARLAWRLAFFRREYDTVSLPPAADKKEITFLSDLITLQGK